MVVVGGCGACGWLWVVVGGCGWLWCLWVVVMLVGGCGGCGGCGGLWEVVVGVVVGMGG